MIDDVRFMRNVADARDNGFDLVCSGCGVGITDEDFEEDGAHDVGCPHEGRDRDAEMAEFLAQRLGAAAERNQQEGLR